MACRHPDIQRFDDIRCCLSCGEALFEADPEPKTTLDESWSPQYRYKPLRYSLGQEIRLVVLFAGDFSDDLTCEIVHVNLADNPVYEAVSYTWADSVGDLARSSHVRCGGKTVHITRNCEAALRHLRRSGRNRRLWIDAICIDQNDVVDKGNQVKLMSKIYANASQVVVYLGIEDSSMIRGFQRVIENLQGGNETDIDLAATETYVRAFIELPYFDRVWILQEIGLARLVTLIIGASEIRWSGTSISSMLGLCSVIGLKPPSALRWAPASRPEDEDVLAVLCKSRNCSATDPRDKVYALLGLTQLRFSSKFPVDYTLTAVEVFTKLAIHCIDEMGRFDILQHCIHSSEASHLEGATWVPQWDFKDVHEPIPPFFSSIEKQRFSETWHTAIIDDKSWLYDEPSKIKLLGQILEQCKETSHSKDGTLSTNDCRGQVKKICAMKALISSADEERLTHYVTRLLCQDFRYDILESQVLVHGEEKTHPSILKLRAHRLDKITRRRLAPTGCEFILPRWNWSAFTFHCKMCKDAKIDVFSKDYGNERATEKERRAFLQAVDSLGAGKMAFESEHSVGLTRMAFELGDSIWILHGTDVPFILRQVDNHYILVGECYLHRAGRPFPCKHCGADAAPWPMQTEIIEIW